MELGNIRVRHAMLLGAYIQTKNYLECIERGYLGDLVDIEKTLIEEMKKTLPAMEKILSDYFNIETDILT